ncbi:MAG: hypothetical protein AAGI11_08795 [Pseudomonadota bacterium]
MHYKTLQAIALALVSLCSSHSFAQAMLVNQSDSANWSFFPTGPVPVTFSAEQATTGNGSLGFGPISSTPADKFLMSPPYGSAAGGLSIIANVGSAAFASFSYDFYPTGGDASNFYLNVYVDLGGDGPAASFYDCRYDYVPGGSTDAWNTFTVTAASTPDLVTPQGGSICPATLSATGINDEILYMVVNGGQSTATDTGLGGFFDNVALSAGGETASYDFEDENAISPDVSADGAVGVPALPAWWLVLTILALTTIGLRRGRAP